MVNTIQENHYLKLEWLLHLVIYAVKKQNEKTLADRIYRKGEDFVLSGLML